MKQQKTSCHKFDWKGTSCKKVKTEQSMLNLFSRSATKLIAMVTLFTITLINPVYAGSVISQSPLGGSVSNSFVTIDPNGSDADTWVYDDFIAAQDGVISNITWEGQLNSNVAGFTIQILNQQPTTPDTIASSTVVKTINVPDSSSQVLNANGYYDYHIDLLTPFNLVAGTHYWITIYANGTIPWGWSDGSGGDNKSISFNRGQAKWLPNPGDRAFSLNHSTVTANLSQGEVGLVYSSTLTNVNAANSVAVSGSVPLGLTVDLATGQLTGTPTVAGSYTFTVVGNTVDDVFNIVIGSPVLVSTTSLVNGTVSVNYSAVVAGTGGVLPYGWSVTGTLPAGITFNPTTSMLTGLPKPGSVGVYSLNFTVSDALHATGQKILTLSIVAAPIVKPPVVKPPVVKPPVVKPPVVKPPVVKPPVVKQLEKEKERKKS